jgi:hypothetical protein
MENYRLLEVCHKVQFRCLWRNILERAEEVLAWVDQIDVEMGLEEGDDRASGEGLGDAAPLERDQA